LKQEKTSNGRFSAREFARWWCNNRY